MAHRKKEPLLTPGGVSGKVRHRHPKFNVGIERMFEAGSYHADHTVGLAIQNELLCGEIGIAVQTLAPHFLVDDSQLRAAGTIFALREGAADQRSEIEKLEVVSRNKRAAHAIRPLAAGDIHTLSLKDR